MEIRTVRYEVGHGFGCGRFCLLECLAMRLFSVSIVQRGAALVFEYQRQPYGVLKQMKEQNSLTGPGLHGEKMTLVKQDPIDVVAPDPAV
jgi:hypothetical protein